MMCTLQKRKRQRFGVEPISTTTVEPPYCSHGPTLLFERYYSDKAPRSYFACAVYRDRKSCPFFHWQDEVITDEKRIRWKSAYLEYQQGLDDREALPRLECIKSLPPSERCYCHSCGNFLMESELCNHYNHNIKNGITDDEIACPTTMLIPYSDRKSQAQFHFSDSSIQLLSTQLKEMNFTHILCIGAPRLHETLLKDGTIQTLLLDVDSRYARFYSPKLYQRYSMFNNFFYTACGYDICREFLKTVHKSQSVSTAIVIDPPFGGLVQLLSKTVKQLWEVSGKEIPTLLVFPYFLECHINSYLPSLWMMDYQVTYTNHKHFSAQRKKPKPSPVRIFTNLSLPGLRLPSEEGYRFCRICNRYVAKDNNHCMKCDKCTSKDGRTYIHCEMCGKCVKQGYDHCSICNKCELPNHSCSISQTAAGCHICGSLEHKRKDCPEKIAIAQPLNKRKRKAKEM